MNHLISSPERKLMGSEVVNNIYELQTSKGIKSSRNGRLGWNNKCPQDTKQVAWLLRTLTPEGIPISVGDTWNSTCHNPAGTGNRAARQSFRPSTSQENKKGNQDLFYFGKILISNAEMSLRPNKRVQGCLVFDERTSESCQNTSEHWRIIWKSLLWPTQMDWIPANEMWFLRFLSRVDDVGVLQAMQANLSEPRGTAASPDPPEPAQLRAKLKQVR